MSGVRVMLNERIIVRHFGRPPMFCLRTTKTRISPRAPNWVRFNHFTWDDFQVTKPETKSTEGIKTEDTTSCHKTWEGEAFCTLKSEKEEEKDLSR